MDMNVGFKIGGRESAAWARRGAQSALVPRDLRTEAACVRLPVLAGQPGGPWRRHRELWGGRGEVFKAREWAWILETLAN